MTSPAKFKIDWIDSGREPQCAPNPDFPTGIDINIARLENALEAPSCFTLLPYPAKRCGYFYVECETCGTNAVITTAGRRDDPRSVRIPCRKNPQ